MKAFHTVAIPHDDIKNGTLEMNVFAADLWSTKQGTGPEEYTDPKVFFRKTYETDGLKELLENVQKRVKGQGGDPVLQVQTPFGGGKTHSMIALYHKAAEWGAQRVVLVGTVLDGRKTLWGEIEKQLTGKIDILSGMVSPGREALHEVLSKNGPVLILVDELMEYMTKASGFKVGETTLAEQTLAFMQELSEEAGVISGVCVLVTLQSSIIEQSSEAAEKMLTKLKKVMGRKEKVYAPVKDNEVTKIIRKRLFSNIDEDGLEATVSKFVDYAEEQSILPVGIEKSDYRARFCDSYPFLPEVIDVLYHRWGSFPEFQRTRGVLRILALLVYSVLNKEKAYISLADFDLENQDIRQELIKFTGSEFNSVIASDITGEDSGTKRTNQELGKAYQNLNIATRIARTIFLYSFSGGREHGATRTDIKRQAASYGNPAAIVYDCLGGLKNKLFYLQNADDKYFFSNKPNLNRVIQTKMENVSTQDMKELEDKVLKSNISGNIFKTFIGERSYGDITDSYGLKLLVLESDDISTMVDITKNKGSSSPRVNRNTIIFLCPGERSNFDNLMKKKLAYDAIDRDITLELADLDRKKLLGDMKKITSELNDAVHRVYRKVYVPTKEVLSEEVLSETDLGVPTYGENKTLDERIYEHLKSESKLLDKLAPIVISEKYLKENDYLRTEQLWKSHLQTPGEPMLVSREVLEATIIEGLKNGIFGLGMKEGSEIRLLYFNDRKNIYTQEIPTLQFSSVEILISSKKCFELSKSSEETKSRSNNVNEGAKDAAKTTSYVDSSVDNSTVSNKKQTSETTGSDSRGGNAITNLELNFKAPKGKISDIMRIINYMQTKFESIEFKIKATDGSLTESEYENRIVEAFDQMEIDVDE